MKNFLAINFFIGKISIMKNKTLAKKEMKALILNMGLSTVAKELDITERYVKMIRDGKPPSKRLYRDIFNLLSKIQS